MAMVTFIPVISKLADYVVAPVGRQFLLIYNRKKNVEDFQKQVKTLNETREDVLNSIMEAINSDREIKLTVRSWLAEVDVILAEAEEVDNEAKTRLKCLKGSFPDFLSRYKLSKMVVKQTKKVRDLLDQRPKEEVSISIPPLNLPLFSDKGKDVADESEPMLNIIVQQREAVDNIMEALQDEDCKIVGIYGMGGIGKTTLAKEVGKVARACNLFNVVVYAVVSQSPDIRNIQGQIADILHLKLIEESEMGRAGRLYKKLSENKVLVMLDDVWSSIDLAAIGIPCGIEHKSCKIMITTRRVGVLRNMGAKEIPLRLLSSEESWHLFMTNAKLAISSVSSELVIMIMDIVQECQGLPLALVAVGRSLRGKSAIEWTAALQLLKKSQPMSEEYAEENVFSCLALSYDYLKNEETKSCFLMCSLYPEDHDIQIEHLARYGMGRQLFMDVDKIEEARSRAHLRVGELKASGLLLESDKEGCIKMHDMVRDFAISIGSGENHGFLIKSGCGLNEWPRRETLEQHVVISLMSNNVPVLPDGLNCPKLQMLLLGENEGFELIPDAFFAGMRFLKVLDLSERVGVRSLNHDYGLVPNISPLLSSLKFPSSFDILIKLQVLSLDRCKLDDISILGKLKGLEILSLYGSNIKELPDEIGELNNLRLLDLTFCQSLERIPEKLVSNLRRLEELYMGGCSKLWRISKGSPEECCKACLSEIMSLRYLAILCIEVPFVECFPENFHLPKIQKFEITVGYNATICYPSSKTFYFREIKTQIPQAIINILQTTEDLTLFCLDGGLLSSIIDVHQESLNRLKILKVKASVDDYFLVDKCPLNAPIILGALEELHLSLMDSLQYICYGPYGFVSTYSFKKLRILKAQHCRLFITLVTPPLVQRFLSLEEVHVEWCNEVRQIFSLENFTEEEQGIISAGPGHSNRSVCNEGIPGRSNHPSPFWSFPGSRKSKDEGRDILLSKLRKINLDTLPKLQHIWNVIDPLSSTSHHRQVRLDNLTIIEIRHCGELKSVFPFSISQRLRQMEVLSVVGCPNLERIVSKTSEEMHVIQDPPTFPRLRVVHVEYCPKFTNLFSVRTAQSLLQLKELKVSEVFRLEDLISNEDNRKDENLKIVLLKLKQLHISNVHIKRLCPNAVTIDLPSLEELVLRRCHNMKDFATDASKYGLESAPALIKLQTDEQILNGTLAQQIFRRGAEIIEEDDAQMRPLLIDSNND